MADHNFDQRKKLLLDTGDCQMRVTRYYCLWVTQGIHGVAHGTSEYPRANTAMLYGYLIAWTIHRPILKFSYISLSSIPP